MPDPNELVVVQLKQDRMYRPEPAERAVVTVKKGEATVPRWVAQEWGLLPAEADSTPLSDPAAPVTAAEMKALLPAAGPVETPPVKPTKTTKAKAT